MSKIAIKNFGPIREGFTDDGGFIDIKKVTVFIGDQGSGKSSVAKLFATMKWLEKAMYRGDITATKLNDNNFVAELHTYQRIKNHFRPDTEITYHGEVYNFDYRNGKYLPMATPNIETGNLVPKIMYVPAERNFLSTIKDAYDVTGLLDSLFSFAEEFRRAGVELSGQQLDLPIKNYAYEYDIAKDISYIIGPDYKINLLEASSGLQSLTPLYIVSRNLAIFITKAGSNNNQNISVNQRIRRDNEIAEIMQDNSLSDDKKKENVDSVYTKYHNSCFINIVEEPEQNLFPASQRHILNNLVEFANMKEVNSLIMTTHSPYIINYLSIAIQGNYLKQKIEASPKSTELLNRLNKIIPEKSTISSQDVVIYELRDGKIIRLPTFEGIPSDKNYLNQSLAEGNQLFGELLEIEEDL